MHVAIDPDLMYYLPDTIKQRIVLKAGTTYVANIQTAWLECSEQDLVDICKATHHGVRLMHGWQTYSDKDDNNIYLIMHHIEYRS